MSSFSLPATPFDLSSTSSFFTLHHSLLVFSPDLPFLSGGAMKHACTTLNNLLFYNGKASSSQNSSSLASTRHLGSLPSLLKLRVMTATPQHGAHTENVRSAGWQFVSMLQKCDHQLVSLVLAVNTTQVYHCPSACGYSECGLTHSLSENAPQPYAHAHLHRPTHSTLHYIIVTLRSSGYH